MTLNQRIRWIILLSLPIIVLLGWFVTERAPGWMVTVPGWLRTVGADPALGACEALTAVDGYQGEFINFYQPTVIRAPEAPAYARAGVEAATGLTLESAASLSPAALVRATFPQAGERLAWLVIATLPKDADARFDRVAVAFVDGDTGDLLAMNTAVSVTDARTACGGGPVGRRALVRQYLPLLVTAAYVGFLVAGLYLRALWQRRAARRAQASA